MTARELDDNGYIHIDRNPITRVGVFPYLGKSISASLEPEKVYWVYRPAESVGDPEFHESVKLMPIIDDHAMLGPEDEGYIPAEKKGTHGTTGQDVDFDGDVLYSNIKIVSETLKKLLDEGKTDLSLGYRCLYEPASGTYAGQDYQFVQRSLRGNHLALVHQARCNVAVLDHSDKQVFAFDKLDLNINNPKEKDMTITAEELSKRVAAQDEAIATLTATVTKLTAALDEAEKEKEKEAEDADDKEKDDKEGKGEDADEDKDEDDKKKKEGMDALEKRIAAQDEAIKALTKNGAKTIMKEVAARDALANSLSTHIGTFDASDMTADEVAAYGLKQLKIEGVAAGQERAAISGFLAGRTANAQGFGFDSSEKKSTALDKFLNA